MDLGNRPILLKPAIIMDFLFSLTNHETLSCRDEVDAGEHVGKDLRDESCAHWASVQHVAEAGLH